MKGATPFLGILIIYYNIHFWLHSHLLIILYVYSIILDNITRLLLILRHQDIDNLNISDTDNSFIIDI